ncbi:hypothetical protein Pcac1_g11200 [Phytophthora cactorum]|uniref:Uncharacterized protein n=1 Tax=Phytophthora cactorum TaxID=29920 RepID=A0A8T0Y3P8_9STRA|nr:hypothetical protein Pcac1_g11200 [Phytophthora cactorum]KAG2824214.1 hypothetical protein PC113_g22066 [Phytophthora cactorum]KAG3043756.1 hypothetical protein PC121_g22346 [Phytophthora cactorum]
MEEEMMMTQLPPQLHCRLSIKSGEPLTPACRDRLPGHDFAFMVADGYAVLLGHIKRIFESTNGLTWIEPVAVYAKPTNNMPQNNFLSTFLGPGCNA